MISCYVLCGIPGSGKTTLAHQLAEQHNAVVHSYDDIPGAWGTPDVDGKIRKQWLDNIKADLQSGNSVVCDSTALTAFGRKHILNEVSSFDCKKILVVKVVPLEICIQRNESRTRKVSEGMIKLTARLLQPPTEDEGWDEIYVHKE